MSLNISGMVTLISFKSLGWKNYTHILSQNGGVPNLVNIWEYHAVHEFDKRLQEKINERNEIMLSGNYNIVWSAQK